MSLAVASRYARALADAVLGPKSDTPPAAAAAQLGRFQEAVQQSPELRNVLLSPAVSAARKRNVVEQMAPAFELSRLVRNFLYVLIDHRRVPLLGEIRKAFEVELDARLGILRAQVSSAQPLNDGQRAAVEAQLSQLTGKQVRAQFDVNPQLLGGVSARIGSTVYDGSARGQLEALRQRLVHQ
jgi:F-type H+-transporting ATPase subunit delta